MLGGNTGLTTKYCCQGDENNDFYIMFDDKISDIDIEQFLIKFSNQYNHTPFCGKFVKWARKMSGIIKSNWIMKK